MKFLLISSYPQSILNFRGELIYALQSKEVEVHVAAPGLINKRQIKMQLVSKDITTHNIKLSRNGLNPFSDLITFFQLLKLIKKLKPEYVLAYTIKPVIYGMLAASLSRVPNCFALITGLGSGFTDKAGLLRKLLKVMYCMALQCSHKVFYQNPDDKSFFESLKIIKQSKPSVVVNGSGVNLDYFSGTQLPQKPSFLMIARLLESKGVREYVQAAILIKNKYQNIEFSLVGWIDDNPDAIKKNELYDWVSNGDISYLGKLEDVRPVISDCSVYVLPSYYREGTPRTVLEAMAMGRPIITTDAPGCRETVVHGRNGFLIPVKDSFALSEAMVKFIKKPELIEKMGLESRKIAEEKYDVYKVNAVMLKEMGIY